MLKLKDLKNRVYSGKVCTRFECEIPINDDGDIAAAIFRKHDDNPGQQVWVMQIVFDRTRDKDSEVYNFSYIMPKANVPLELVAATGLKYFQLTLKQEIQSKSNLDFVLGEMLSGM